MNFEWDAEKAEANFKKHGVSFDEAKTVFRDPMYLIFADPDHSIGESRFLVNGPFGGGSAFVRFVYRAKIDVADHQCKESDPTRTEEV